MDRNAIEQARNAGAPLVGDQRDMMAAPDQLFGQGVGRNHVAAGASGGENEMPRHLPLHRTT
jgi:hypothetical protein